MKLRKTLAATTFVFLASTSLALAEESQAASGTVIRNRAPLQANAFDALPLGAIEPQGWLRDQLKIQAAGLTGHLGDFWNDVGPNSGWLGGSGDAWERGPYYLDGLLPLAYELNDGTLISKSKQWVNWTLSHQRADGQIGPASNDDWWPRMVMLKVLTQYEEVSGDSRVIPVMAKYFQFELQQLPARPLRDWGKYRWQDNVYSVLWLYNRTGDANLLSLARLLKQQGYDWELEFKNFRYTTKETREKLGLGESGAPGDMAMQTHGVNNAMALKAAPVWFLMSGDVADKRALAHQLEMLDRYHGLPNGMFSGDEHFAGADPSQGIELCAVVEAMFSLEQAFAILGDPRIADRLEKVAYNALPGTLSNDMWSHQYDQQPNQIACTRAHRQWSTNGPDSNLFGLAPNFGCCTANLHQGWPKLESSLWMATPDGGLVAAVYAPNRVRTKLAGAITTIDEKTEYPFRGSVQFTVHPESPARFPLILRIPVWASGGTGSVDGQAFELHPSGCTLSTATSCSTDKAFYRIERVWKSGDRVDVHFDMAPTVTHWYNDAAVFSRGPLVFSLPLDEQWSELKHYAEKSADWQIMSPQPWNYAVALGPCDARATERPLSATPFDVDNPAVELKIRARLDQQWGVESNSAGLVPLSPVQSSAAERVLTLVPYGAAKLRITAFPFLAEKTTCEQASVGTAAR